MGGCSWPFVVGVGGWWWHSSPFISGGSVPSLPFVVGAGCSSLFVGGAAGCLMLVIHAVIGHQSLLVFGHHLSIIVVCCLSLSIAVHCSSVLLLSGVISFCVVMWLQAADVSAGLPIGEG